MILGIFAGKNPTGIRARIEKLNKEQQAIRGTIDAAVSDRISAIKELRDEVTELEVLKQSV